MNDTEDPFVKEVTPVYKRLLVARERFYNLDTLKASHEMIDSFINRIEEAEKAVLVAWAKATAAFNPGMLADVEAGRMRWYPALDDYMRRMLPL